VIRAPRFMPSQEGPMDMTASLTAPDLATRFRMAGTSSCNTRIHSHGSAGTGGGACHGVGAGERSRGQQP